jgi:uncharacterized protein YutE (UPF0331/DUF86 family)
MTEPHLVAKKLALMETYLRQLRTEVRQDLVLTDLRELRFAEHTLQIAIQAALDIASHVVSDERLGEPATNRALFDLLAQHGWIDAPLAARLRQMVGFRNILVHGYAEVDPAIVKDVLEHHLDDLDLFATAIRARTPGPG